METPAEYNPKTDGHRTDGHLKDWTGPSVAGMPAAPTVADPTVAALARAVDRLAAMVAAERAANARLANALAEAHEQLDKAAASKDEPPAPSQFHRMARQVSEQARAIDEADKLALDLRQRAYTLEEALQHALCVLERSVLPEGEPDPCPELCKVLGLPTTRELAGEADALRPHEEARP